MSNAELERQVLYEASSRSYEEERRQQLAQEWIAHHAKLQVTFDGLAAHHEREQARYRAMLLTTSEGEEDERVPA